MTLLTTRQHPPEDERPDRRNAMTLDMYRGVRDTTIIADQDPEIDAVCLRGTDDGVCVGGDMSLDQEDSAALKERDPSVNFPFRHMELCRKIVVAAVNGACHAGGLNLLMHSDVSIAVDTADPLRRHDHNMFKRSMMNPERVEGMRAFMEKRKPDWPRD